ncbi:NAD(P)-dependent alcohol dehydrogenase [Mesobaculum littorinae]|uniref:NAD(P)-dependent alcohol dehydrogenase n=1 Tax=Mesobaculum littorinae TaxID=2486419 RepID=A0A438ALB1_9RHOB|nr:NAD(P)-dependent alcohol dehydrogenase [Mesobaculum littorinae]RVV99367.1 NAD(P)-dependent alcohol dehydrogenase [Mesobaculum littorinae]
MTTQIRAAVAREAGAPLSLEDLTLDAPRADEVLVRIVATGVCHTDLVVIDGHLPTPLPAVLGHEGAGVVEAVGSNVTKVAPGDRVVLTFNTCGTCPSCRDNAMAYCHEFFPRNFFGQREDGSVALQGAEGPVHSNFFGQSSFATHALGHARNVVRIDVPEADLPLMGPLACGIQTGAGTVMNALKVPEGASFVVFGTGSVGLAAVMAARAQGAATIIAVDLHDTRLHTARDLGATHVVNAGSDNVVGRIREITGGGAGYALDTTGQPAVIRQAVDALGSRGTAAVLGAPMPGSEITLDNSDFMSSGKRLMGVVEGDSDGDTFIPRLVDLWKAGHFPFDRLVTFYPFDRINDAIEDSQAGRTIKPVVTMS